MEIKICGPGCAKCDEVEKLVREVVASEGVVADIEKVKDFNKFAAYGVFTTPAVVIDGRVVCVGTIPSKDEIASWL